MNPILPLPFLVFPSKNTRSIISKTVYYQLIRMHISLICSNPSMLQLYIHPINSISYTRHSCNKQKEALTASCTRSTRIGTRIEPAADVLNLVEGTRSTRAGTRIGPAANVLNPVKGRGISRWPGGAAPIAGNMHSQEINRAKKGSMRT